MSMKHYPQDITWCSESPTCPYKNCMRHTSHMVVSFREEYSFADFSDKAYCLKHIKSPTMMKVTVVTDDKRKVYQTDKAVAIAAILNKFSVQVAGCAEGTYEGDPHTEGLKSITIEFE